jgi:hypothetical protein
LHYGIFKTEQVSQAKYKKSRPCRKTEANAQTFTKENPNSAWKTSGQGSERKTRRLKIVATCLRGSPEEVDKSAID